MRNMDANDYMAIGVASLFAVPFVFAVGSIVYNTAARRASRDEEVARYSALEELTKQYASSLPPNDFKEYVQSLGLVRKDKKRVAE